MEKKCHPPAPSPRSQHNFSRRPNPRHGCSQRISDAAGAPCGPSAQPAMPRGSDRARERTEAQVRLKWRDETTRASCPKCKERLLPQGSGERGNTVPQYDLPQELN